MINKMDDSQSSDFFSETGTSIYDVSTVDEESYQTLFNKIKKTTIAKSTVKNVRTEEICKTLLNDCRDCADQSFNIIISLLEDSTIDIEKVSSYIGNVVQILQILSTFIKHIIEMLPLTCCTIKTFPTCTGSIIELVFSHCRDSEFIYEHHLTLLEKELKELFRSCHDLQLTYLMTLQNHFSFDLSIEDEQEILLKALDINLKIGEVVQSLDVKTMAEQWKAYTVICEKYSTFLLDKNTYNNCTQLLASSIYKNITAIMEAEEKDKIIVRSLKVASFSLKILLKISIIFKEAKNVDFDCIIQLLCSIKLCDSNYHELLSNKSSELSSLMYGHLSPPSDALLLRLVNEEEFIENILSMNISDFKHSKYLGYILILISVMKVIMKSQKNINGVKNKVIDRVFCIIKKCHIWFNIGLRIISVANSRFFHGLYEHLLLHTTAFISMFTSEEYILVEKILIESLLANDFYIAIFSANLWLLLCKVAPNQFHINILHNLIKMYQMLEDHTAFTSSPQENNLKYTIKQLFGTLKYKEKLALYKTYNLQEDQNIGIWCALKINNLPENLAIVAEKMVIEKLLEIYRDVCEHQRNMDKLIKHMQLATTCAFVEHYPELEDFLTSLWSKFCVSCNDVPQILMNLSSMCHLTFLRHLTSLTDQYKNKFYKSNNVLQILNVMSKLLQLKNAELSVILFETFCELIHEYSREHDHSLQDLLINALRNYSHECDIQRQIFTTLLTNKQLYDFILPIFHKSVLLAEIRRHFDAFEEDNGNIVKWRENLEIASDYHFEHKCIENTMSEVHPTNNFEMDFECLFEDEPACKKAKFDIKNVENIICDLERNVVRLSEIKDDVLCTEYKDRLESVCEKIRNIVS